MKKIAALFLGLSLLLWGGCGGDNNNSSTEPTPTEKTVTAVASATAPSMTDVNDAVWNQATVTTIAVTSGLVSPKTRPVAAQSVASQVSMKAVVSGSDLYLRFVWSDATFDAWPDAWEVDSLLGPNPVFRRLVEQDQMLVLFKGLPNNVWDVWQWKVHSTAMSGDPGGTITGYAEGRTLSGTHLITDEGDAELVRENHAFGTFNRPTFLHEDTMMFHGFILKDNEADSLGEGEFPSTGWEANDTVPGYITFHTFPMPPAQLGSRWDVQGVWTHASGQYTVVLRRALDTGHADDLAMSAGDKVPMKVILTNKLTPTFSTGSSDQGITGLFYLKLP